MLSESIWRETGIVLLRMSVAGTFWLLLGALLLLTIREPVRRTRACGLILLGSLMVPLLALTVPGNLWGPPAPLQVEVPDLALGRTTAEAPLVDQAGRPAVPATVVTLPIPLAEQGLLEQAGIIDDSAESSLPIAPTPSAMSTPVNLVGRADRYGITRLSPAEASSSWWGLLSAAYVLGAGMAAAWYFAGLAGLARLVRGAADPSPSLESVWQAVRGDDLASTPLLVSGDLRQPIACWWRRSTVLLPATWHGMEEGRIEAALTHEAEHIRRGDFWWWQVANLARIVFWFHPLAWWLRRELRIGQDFLADAAVVRSQGSRVEYAEFLTSSASLELRHVSLVGLGLIGGRSELYRRVAMLLNHERPLEIRVPRWWNAALLTGGVFALGAAATMRVIAEPPPKPASSPPPGLALDVSPSVTRPAGEANRTPNSANPFASGASSATAVRDTSTVDPFATVVPDSTPSPVAQSPANRDDPATPGLPASQAPVTLGAGTVIRKLTIQNGVVTPEQGVTFSIVSLTDPAGDAWKPDGSRIEAEEGGAGGPAFGGGGGMPGGFPAGAGMAPSFVLPPAGGDSILPEARQRSVVLRVQRPLPAGLNLSVDGQTISRVSTAHPDPKIRQITQTASWPDEQMEGSVGVRFASKTIALELIASNHDGETIKNQGGSLEARLGPWRQGGDLQTEISLDGVQANDPRFVIVVQAVDVEGTTHPGRIERRQRPYNPGDAGGYDPTAIVTGIPGSMGGGGGEWLMVFPHLPADRIAKVRLTWHPYAWVIFRNVSLEPEHKTTPTAELYVDPSKPEDRPAPTGGAPHIAPDVSTPQSF